LNDIQVPGVVGLVEAPHHCRCLGHRGAFGARLGRLLLLGRGGRRLGATDESSGVSGGYVRGRGG
jgi:hypothetical protein